MANFWKSVKTNILLGYITLVLIASATVWVIYNETLALTESQFDVNPVNNKILLTNSILTNLYEAEGLERSYLQTKNRKHFNEYNLLMDSIRAQIDSLGILASNPSQQIHTDSIQNLLTQKRENLKELMVIKNAGSSENLYERAMMRLTSNKDSIDQLLGIYKTVSTSRDSIFVKQEKQKFIDRLIHVFSPREKSDSALKVVVNQSTQVDSILNTFSPADTVTHFLSSIMEDIRKESVAFEQQLLEKEQEILENDQTITLQIRKMLSRLENEELINSLLKMGAQQERINYITNIVILLGGVAFFVIIGFLVLILKDITKSQHYRQHLEKEKAYSESLLKSKEQFMLSITHDLKSPLSSIIGFSQLVERENVKERQKHYLERIGQSADYILRLINDLLDFARLETGKLKIENTRFNLKVLIDEVVSGFYPLAASKNLKLELRDDNLPANSYVADPVRIKQILANLISNAIKFTDDGKITVSGSISGVEGRTEWIQLEVTDTGVGISSENTQAIFDEFSRISSKGGRQYEGTGLGLTITKRIVELLNGTIKLHSQYGHGSTFTVLLPLKKQAADSLHEKQQVNKTGQTSDSEKFSFNNEHILLVDDDLFLLEMITNVLREANLQVTPFSQSKEAFRAIMKKPFDLLITDVQMPGMNGFELLSYYRKNTPKTTRSIAVSGDTSEHYRLKNAGFSAFLKKPFQPEELLEQISLVLNGQKVTRQNPATPANNGKDHYSIEGIKAFASGDPETTRQLLISFAETTAENIRLFQTYLKQEDYSSLSKLAHKMLPMFRQLEAESVITPLAILEQQNFNGSENGWKEQGELAMQMIETLMKRIADEHHIPLPGKLIL